MKATIEVQNAYPFTANGRPVSFRRFGNFSPDEGVPTFSGRTTVRFGGWNRGDGASVKLAGSLPGTFLSIVAQVGQ